MTLECSTCGKYEIGPKLYDELMPLPEDHWQIERLRVSISEIAEPKMIWKKSTNIVEVEPVGADKPTKMQKRHLRAKAEGKTIAVGPIIFVGGAEDESST